MDVERKHRFTAASVFGRLLGSEEQRQMLHDRGHRSGQAVIIVLESDPIKDVLDRAQRYDPPVTVAVYHPVRHAFAVVTMEPSQSVATADSPADPESSIGMILDWMAGEKRRRGSIHVTRWYSTVTVNGTDELVPQ